MSARPVAAAREQDHVRVGELNVPANLRRYAFVPRQDARRRSPAWVTPGAFLSRGLAVPDDPRRRNIYRLTEGRGLPWSSSVDRHVGTRGAELLPDGALVLVDIDATIEHPLEASVRWLAGQAQAAGAVFDHLATLAVFTPGHAESGHLPGLHLWFRCEPERQARFGSLPDCPRVELRSRGTCPGSPGYVVRHAPDELPYLPRWLAALAPAPRTAMLAGSGTESACAAIFRLDRIVDSLLAAGPGDHRRNLLFWAANRCREMAESGELDAAVARDALFRASEKNGLVDKRGAGSVRRTIEDGLRGKR